MNQFNLANKTILVTGASSGIGAQCAISIAQMGGKVVLSARDKDRLKATYDQLEGSGHSIILADLTVHEDINNLVEEITHIDGIVHGSGIVKTFPVKFIQQKHINEIFDINYFAPVLLTAQLFKIKKINKKSSIVFISSVSSHFPHKGGALYSGSKAAINSYSKTLALEYAPQNTRSNVISAAMVETPLFENAEKILTKEVMDKHRDLYPLGFGEPNDVANAVVYLLSDAAKWVTGSEMVLDGGLTAGL